MSTILVAAKLPKSFLVPVAICIFSPLLASQQHQQHSRHFISDVRPYTNVEDILNREATATDPAGIHQYSEDLIGLIVPERAGDDYIESLADRLAVAEQMARNGKGNLVPETDVVRAFNDLMRKIGVPFKTDETIVRRFREHSIAVPSLSAILSANRNGTSCTSSEAIYLLHLLIWNNGSLPERILDDEADLQRQQASKRGTGGNASASTFVVSTGHLDEEAGQILTSYSSHHRRNIIINRFNNIARTFGF